MYVEHTGKLFIAFLFPTPQLYELVLGKSFETTIFLSVSAGVGLHCMILAHIMSDDLIWHPSASPTLSGSLLQPANVKSCS